MANAGANRGAGAFACQPRTRPTAWTERSVPGLWHRMSHEALSYCDAHRAALRLACSGVEVHGNVPCHGFSRRRLPDTGLHTAPNAVLFALAGKPGADRAPVRIHDGEPNSKPLKSLGPRRSPKDLSPLLSGSSPDWGMEPHTRSGGPGHGPTASQVDNFRMPDDSDGTAFDCTLPIIPSIPETINSI